QAPATAQRDCPKPLSRRHVVAPSCLCERTMTGMLKEIEIAATSLGTRLRLVPANSPADLDGAFAVMAKERADSLMLFPSPMLFSQYSRIVAFAANNRLPAMYAAREAVDFGGLVSIME